MNLSYIRKQVESMVPAAKDVRITEQGRNLYSMACELQQRTRAVQFNDAGLYGETDTSMWGYMKASDLNIAVKLAKAITQ